MPGKPVEDPDLSSESNKKNKENLPEASKTPGKTEKYTLSGLAKKEDGTICKSKYFKVLQNTVDDYSDLEFTPEEAKKIHSFVNNFSTGATSNVPIICTGDLCGWRDRCVFWQMGKAPVGRQCHPPGEKILTSRQGYIPIEELDPEEHRLVGWERKQKAIRPGTQKVGYGFKITSREYCGYLTNLVTSQGKSYKATHDHICIAKFNENSIGKYCVYLMRKGGYWRVGKSIFIGENKKSEYSHKTFLGFPMRGNREEADAMWILGVYEDNTQALLAEEYFSIKLQTPKALFISGEEDQKRKGKWNGLYRWAQQEDLDKHHNSLIKDESFYREKLEKMGLSIDYPIWERNDYDEKPHGYKLYVWWPMYIRVCNLIPGIMDTPAIPENPQYGHRGCMQTEWETIKSIEKERYCGPVYSLGVDRHGTYFVNDVATHNCLLEVTLSKNWQLYYLEEYDVDWDNMTEISLVNELVEIEVMLNRVNMNMATDIESAVGVTQQTIGFDPKSGQPITQSQISQFHELRERLYNRKHKVVRMLVGDREGKWKKEAGLKRKEGDDASSEMSRLKKEVENLKQKTIDVTAEEVGKLKSGDEKPLSPDDIVEEEK